MNDANIDTKYGQINLLLKLFTQLYGSWLLLFPIFRTFREHHSILYIWYTRSRLLLIQIICVKIGIRATINSTIVSWSYLIGAWIRTHNHAHSFWTRPCLRITICRLWSIR